MPKAIEITLTLRNQEDAGDSFSDDVTDPYALPETTHRMVVPIPLLNRLSRSRPMKKPTERLLQ